MGASASVNQIPSDLLLEEANKSFKHQILTKESLAALRRSSYSTFAYPKIPEAVDSVDLPPHVVSLLEQIGIKSDDQLSTRSNDLSHTTKLVGHIFECLGALQHLVRSNQAVFPNGEDETQSVNDLSTQSVGKLVHEMVSIYGLCGDTIRILLTANPEAATVEDAFGRLPLHSAIDSNYPWVGAIECIVNAFPEALSRRDGAGRLPLHIAVDRPMPNDQVVRMLIVANPASAGARRGVGRLPIHYGMFCDSLAIDTLRCLHNAYPEGVRTVDVYGRLPLHYAVDRANAQLPIVDYLLKIYPEGASIRDSHLRLPLTVAIDREKPVMEVVKLLVNAYPAAVNEPGRGGRLPVHIAVETALVSIPCVWYLLQQCPSSALVPYSRTGNDDSPLAIARRRRNHELLRIVLLSVPHYDPATLWDLNWAARRLAFLLLTDTSSTMSSPNHVDSPRRLSHLQIRFHAHSPSFASNNFGDLIGNIAESFPRQPISRTSSIGTPGVFAHAGSKQNLYLRLYYADEKLFRLAVSFL